MELVRHISLLLLLINSLFFTAYSTPAQKADDMDLHPFVKIGSKYYSVHNDLELNWHGAAHLCRSYDSDLLTIESETEKDALFSHLRRLHSFARIWTSSNDLSEEGKYVSLNSGRPMNYTFWGPSEPNDLGNGEDCVEALLIDDSFTMNDGDCSNKLRVICEKRLPLNTHNSTELLEFSCALKSLVNKYLPTSNANNCKA